MAGKQKTVEDTEIRQRNSNNKYIQEKLESTEGQDCIETSCSRITELLFLGKG